MTETGSLVSIWNVNIWKKIKEIKLDGYIFRDNEFSNNDSLLAIAGGYGGLLIYETENWELIKKIDNQDLPPAHPYYYYEDGIQRIRSLSFSYDDKYLAFSGDRTFIYDIEKDEIVREVSGMYPVFSPAGNQIAVQHVFIDAGHYPNKYYNDGLDYINLDTGDSVYFYVGKPYERTLFTNDGRYLITGQGTAKIFDLTTNQLKRELQFISGTVYDISHDNKYLVGYGGCNFFRLVNIENIVNVESQESNITLIKNAYPNPADNTLFIEYELDSPGNVNLYLNDLEGNQYKIIVNK